MYILGVSEQHLSLTDHRRITERTDEHIVWDLMMQLNLLDPVLTSVPNDEKRVIRQYFCSAGVTWR